MKTKYGLLIVVWLVMQQFGVKGWITNIGGSYHIFATNEISALHEVGHLVDYEGGNISDTIEFQEAVVKYYYNYTPEYNTQLFTFITKHYENGRYDELFAQLYMWDILMELPTEFEEFYAR